MSPVQKSLKMLSLVVMALGLLQLVGGVLMLAAPDVGALLCVRVSADMAAGAVSDGLLGAANIVAGLLGLYAGASGSIAANRPRSAAGFKRAGILLVVICVLVVALGLVAGRLSWLVLVLAVLGVCACVAAVRASEEAADR
ncbi:hypothetical protein [Olsenella profusa]|uniref:Uncharacterized protein n=1 Tax=Olsenella profusa TaxID=138595 RepID=A0ABS2F4X3_9ACTN|nr:hypothetical protein [Olsenella profusa]MBM6775579.1 hypothetical protein [Olsenella profusa]